MNFEERTQSFEYDSLGRMTRSADPNGYITRFFYNSAGQLEKTIDAEGNVTRNEHDHLGNVIKSIKEYRLPNGDFDKESVTTFVYENGNELKQYIDDANNVTEYSYDLLGRLVSTKLPGNENLIYTQSYNGEGQVTVSTMPDGTVVNNNYNNRSQIESIVVNKSSAISANHGADYYFYTYNLLRQVERLESRKGGALGAIVSQLDYIYDSSGRAVSETQTHGSLPGRTITSIFDDTNNKNRLIHPSGLPVDYQRDSLGRLFQIVKNGNVLVKENTFVGSKQARIKRGHSLTQDLTYGNGNELLSSQYHNSDLSTIVDFELGYNKVYYKNFEKRHHESGKGDRYKYNSVYHLIETAYGATVPEASDVGFEKKEVLDYSTTDFRNSIKKFDPLGLLDEKYYAGNALHQAIGIDNSQAVAVNRVYNLNGNLTQDEKGNLYEYDHANRLVKVRTKDNANNPIDVIFTYDATGRKIQKQVIDVNTQTATLAENYYYSGEEVIAEYDGNSNLLRSYILGERIDIPVSVTENGFDYYFVNDPHGSVVAITNANGVAVERYKYDAHGNFEILLDSPSINNRYFYSARDWEPEIKLYHNRARFYDPENGFFIQRDPLGYVDGSNPYIYTSGNSVNYSDPLGLEEEENKLDPDDKVKNQVLERFFKNYKGEEDRMNFLFFILQGHDIKIVDHTFYDAHDYGEYIGLDVDKAKKDLDEITREFKIKLDERYRTWGADLAQTANFTARFVEKMDKKYVSQEMFDEEPYRRLEANARKLGSDFQHYFEDQAKDAAVGGGINKLLKYTLEGASALVAMKMVGDYFDARKVVKMNPASITLSHPANLSKPFSNSSLGTVGELVEKLKADPSYANKIPPIEVYKYKGTLYSANNRRLRAFQEAGIEIRTIAASKEAINEIKDRVNKMSK